MKRKANKVILVICDGLGDRPCPELGEQTPLEAAATPNLDSLASKSMLGMMHTVGRGITPGSDVAHLALFGYDLSKHYFGRGPIEAAGVGLKLMDGDVAFRGNLATVNPDGKIVDRRAGRIRSVTDLVAGLDGYTYQDVRFTVKPGTAHRAIVVMHGKDLSSAVSDVDPHGSIDVVSKPTPTDKTPQARKTAEALENFLAFANAHLNSHQINKSRISAGSLPANYVLVRGAGKYSAIPSFYDKYHLKAACVAGGGLYKGIGAYLQMDILDVPGATALPDTDIKAKFTKAVQALEHYDFVFVHVKATDSLGEDSNAIGKRDFIQRIDEALPILANRPTNCLLAMTADHSTPCVLGAHSADPVPVLINGLGIRPDVAARFTEATAKDGSLGWIIGNNLIPEILNVLGQLHPIGG